MKCLSTITGLILATTASHAVLPFYELKDVGPWKPSYVVNWASPRVNEEGRVTFSLASSPRWVGQHDPATGHTYTIGAGGNTMILGTGLNDHWAATGTVDTGSHLDACMAGSGWDFVMGRPVGYQNATGLDINNNYEVVGIANPDSGVGVHSFKYTFWTGFQILPNFPSAGILSNTQPYALNTNGDVCGHSYASPSVSTNTRGWFWDGTATTAMPFVGPMDTNSLCLDVNDFRVVVGNSGHQACYWFPDWGITGYLPAGPGYSQARAITNSGIIVGNQNDTAVAWEGISTPVLLQSRVTVGGFGWNLVVATDNSETGYITGIGYKNGQARVFLLKPI